MLLPENELDIHITCNLSIYLFIENLKHYSVDNFILF